MYLSGNSDYDDTWQPDITKAQLHEQNGCDPSLEAIPVSVTISPVGAPGGARERVAEALRTTYGGVSDGETAADLDVWLKDADRILAALNAAPRPVEALVVAYEEYIALLNAEIGSLVGLADIHGWKSERVEAGKAAREKIKVARAALAAMKWTALSKVYPTGDFDTGHIHRAGLCAADLHAALALPDDPPAAALREAWCDVLAERTRQIEVEGWDAAHDEEWEFGQLSIAAICYALSAEERETFVSPEETLVEYLWPWDWKWWKPKDRRRDLVRAAALIIAEIDRLDRKKAPRE
jgi:hypothetical protein